MNERIRRRARAAIPLFVALTFAGCGASRPQTGAGESDRAVTEGGRWQCKPVVQRSPRLESPRQRAVDERFTVELPSKRGSRVEITVTGARAVPSIRDRYGEEGAFVAPHGFVAVHYKMRNLGPGPVEPGAQVSRHFQLADATSRSVDPVDRIERCAGAAPSYARDVARLSPEIDQGPGQEVTTVALYAVSGSPRRIAWTAPLLGVEVPLGDLSVPRRGARARNSESLGS